MKIVEFFNKYNLHDSFIESLSYNHESRTLVLNIEFAFWMQEFYKEGERENGLIRVCFKGVSKYQCNENPAGAFVGILSTELKNEDLVINLLDDETNEFFEMCIRADSVDVTDEM